MFPLYAEKGRLARWEFSIFPAAAPGEGGAVWSGGRLFAANMENTVDKSEIFVKINKVQKAYAFSHGL
nr:hypothetical protein [uncultured Oscillibacter sp.]